jgi:ribosomal protein S1
MSTNNTSNKPTSASSGRVQSAMAQLMARHQNKFVTLKKGETVKAKLSKLTSGEILVDTGAKTEALVLEKDKRIQRIIFGMFKVGDTVEVNVLNPESETGQPIVSLRRYLGNIAWNKLEELQKSKKQMEVVISDVTKAGYLVTTEFGVSGFLPQSHTAQSKDLQSGMQLKVTVLELNRKDNKIIFSQKTALSEEDFGRAMKAFKVGDKVSVTVSNVTPFGLFVTLPLSKDSKDVLEGFIHVSETSWEKVNDLSSVYTAGDTIEAIITRFDSDTRRINLSVKRLTKDPFEELMEQFPIDKKVAGVVSVVEDSGVSLELDNGIEGIIRKEKIPPTINFTVGQKISAIVSEYDKKRHKIVLVPVLLEKPLGYR